MTFGERVRHYRTQRGMSQSELASAVGRGHAMLSMLERGQRQFHVDELATFARVLNVPPGALLGTDDGDLYAEGYQAGYVAALERAQEALTALNQPGPSYAKHLEGQPANPQDPHTAVRGSRKQRR